MSIKTTLVLLLLLVAVGLSAWFWPEGARVGPSAAGELPVLAPAWCDPARLSSITIHRGADEVTLAPARDAWRQVLPVDFALHPQALDEITAQLARLRSFQRLAPEDPEAPPPSDLQLDPPLAWVKLQPVQGGARVLLLGRTAPGNRAYLRIEGEPALHVVNHDLHRLILDQSPSDRLDRALRPPPAERLETLSVERLGEEVRLRREGGAWRFEPPLTGRAAQAGVEAVTRGVSGLSVLGFVEHDREARSLGLDKPELVVRFETPSVGGAGGESWTLKLGGAADLTGRRRYASWSRAGLTTPAAVVELDAAQAAALPTGVDALRDRRVTPARLENVRELAISGPGRLPVRLIKTTEGWVFAGKAQGEAREPPFPADPIEAAALVAQAVQATATGFVAAPRVEGPPVVELSLRGLGGLEDGWALHRAGGVKPGLPASLAQDPALARGAVVAVRAGETVGYVLPEEQLARVTAPVHSLRDRVIFDAAASPLRALALRLPGGTSLSFERRLSPLPGATGAAGEADGAGGQAWGLVGHDRFEREDFARLLRLLEPLRAEAWVEGPAPASAVELALTPERGEPVAIAVDPVSRIATRVTGGAGPEAFRLSPELVRGLTLEYRRRSIWPAGAEMARVTVARGPDALAVERGPDGKFRSPQAAALHEAAAARLFSTLAGLRAVRYLPEREAPGLAPAARLDGQTVAGARGSLTLWELQMAPGEYLARYEAAGWVEPGRPGVVWLTVTAASLEGLTAPLVQRR